MQPYHHFNIHPALKEIVNSITVMQIDFTIGEMNSVYRFPWMNNMHLCFTMCDYPLRLETEDGKGFRACPLCYIVGPRLLNDVIDFGPVRHAVGIIFKPGGFQRLTGIPVQEFVNQEFDAALIFGKEIKETEMRLKEAETNEDIQYIIEQFLFRQMRSAKAITPFDEAVAELVKYNGNLSMETFADYACVSTRQLERKSFEKLGIGPKLYARLTRFSQAYAMKERNPDMNWTSIAHLFGYFDQAHLIKDFKSFAGFNPKALEQELDSSVKMMAALEGK